MSKSPSQRKSISRARLSKFGKEVSRLQKSDFVKEVTLIRLKNPVFFQTQGRVPAIAFCDNLKDLILVRNRFYSNQNIVQVAIVVGGFLISPNIEANVEPALCSFPGIDLGTNIGIAFPIMV
ncbi:hypothetical protein [Yersinia ruckeri]|uniref:hypothetical protein n=1 Tax=Yersinia ruckeri TaxID=29486 RepID=UPI002237AD6B|nr:hypothetical protein [Yersinia ruckeri]MCW6598871.1 hypothetical protein [Yersinia ruckeri]